MPSQARAESKVDNAPRLHLAAIQAPSTTIMVRLCAPFDLKISIHGACDKTECRCLLADSNHSVRGV